MAAGYVALFEPLMRAAHRACLEHARLTRDDGWPSVQGCLDFARLYEVQGAELAAFFGHVSYQHGKAAPIWVDVLAGDPGSYDARRLASREQARALGFQQMFMELPVP